MEQKDIPKANYMKYDEDELEILYDQLEDEFLEEVNEKKKISNRLIIFDDVAYGSHLKKSSGIISKIVMNGRHLCLSSLFTTQKFSLVSTNIRTNLTGTILFNTSQKELELIAEDFNYLPKKAQFIQMFRDATREKNSFLVVNFSNKGNEMYLDSNFEPIDTSKYTS